MKGVARHGEEGREGGRRGCVWKAFRKREMWVHGGFKVEGMRE